MGTEPLEDTRVIPFRSTLRLLAVAFTLLPMRAHATELSIPGIPNFHQVNERIYRGAQPTDDAWPNLARFGVKTVIDLRRPEEHSITAEAKAVTDAGMRYVNIPINGFDTPSPEVVARVLEQLDSGDSVFVHCKLGMDRTGTVVAAYRISRDRWDNRKAADEAMACGLHWYEFGMKRFIRDYRPAVAAPESNGGATAAGDSTHASGGASASSATADQATPAQAR